MLRPMLQSHAGPTAAPSRATWEELEAATADLEPPYAVVDLGALRANTADLARRAAGKPIRVASKSVRSRALVAAALREPGYAGVLAYTLPEALWLAGDPAYDFDDVVVGYPTVDRQAIARLGADERLAARVTMMVDSVEHLDLIASVVGPTGPPIRVCIELDASLRLAGGRVHLGARRSPVHGVAAAEALARAVVRRPRLRLVGLMAYEGQVAGLGDNRPGPARFGVRLVQRVSVHELAERRAAAVAAVRRVADLEFVNGGGTGSLESTSAEDAVTEVAAGSGLFAPRLFDHYTRFHPHPAAYFVLPVVRRPSPQHATVLGGGWIASGPVGPDRLPTPVRPAGLSLLPGEGAGEVQTPLTGEAASALRVGDRVWFRHAKAGELCEHVDGLHLVERGEVVDEVATYRGEGMTFL